MVPIGKHKSRVKNYAIRPVKTGPTQGQPAAIVAFAVRDEHDAEHIVFWQGSFSDKAKKYTLEALFHCGLSSPEAIIELASGPVGGALDMDRDVEIDVIHESRMNDQGQAVVFAKVNWINPLGGSAFMNMMSKTDFSYHVTSMGLQGEFLEIARRHGIDIPKPRSNDPLDLPF